VWSAYANACVSAILATDESDASRQVPLLGGSDGYLRKLDVNAFSIDSSTAISAVAQTPTLSYAMPHLTKVLTAGSIGFQPLTDGTVTFEWHRDNKSYASLSINQGGGDILAPTSGTAFTLDTSYLGGGQFNDVWFETENGGEFRNMYYVITNADLAQNFSIHSMSAFVRGGALSLENA